MRFDDRTACRGGDRRRRTVGADRRRRARAIGSTARSSSSNAKPRPAESRATATIPATACATSSGSSQAPPTPSGSPQWHRMPAPRWRPRPWSPTGQASDGCRSPHRAAFAPSRPTPWCWRPVRGSDRGPRDWCQAIAPTASTPRGNCRTSCTCTTRHVGSRALIVGAELVSWSAVLTLREAGCATVGMVSGYPRSEAYAMFRDAGPVPDGWAGVHPQPGRRHRRQGPCARRRGGEHRHRLEDDGRLRHRGVHRRLDPRPRTGPHRRPGDGSRDSRARWSTRACGPAAPGCSRSATCCTPSTPPTAPRWTDAMWWPR